MKPYLSVLPFALLAIVAFNTALAQPETKPDAKPETKAEAKPDAWSAPSTTTHTITIDGKPVTYTATAGFTELKEDDGKLKARLFSVAYVRQPIPGEAEPPQSRPVLFSFNGGPGSSSTWMHMGMSGPRRVKFADPAESPTAPALPRPPYELVDNEQSWLDVFDIVYIDPISTGYSRPAEGVDKSTFHGLEEDIRWNAEFIRLWITQNNRWLSPKYIIGASYGTTRAGGLSSYLQDNHGLYLSGIIMVSPVLNFGTIRFDQGNDTPFWLYLPAYTAIAHYHRALAPDLLARPVADVIKESEAFAQGDYLQALTAGDTLTPERRKSIIAQLARLTGLSPRYIDLANLRFTNMNFAKELLRDKGTTIGRLDARFTGFDRSGVTAEIDNDPSYDAIQGPFTAAVNHYLRVELGFKHDPSYEVLTSNVNPWSYRASENRYAQTADALRKAMNENRALRVLVLAGYYDLATPHFASDYTFNRLGLPEPQRANITRRYYEAGHMPYIRHSELIKLKSDVRAWITSTP